MTQTSKLKSTGAAGAALPSAPQAERISLLVCFLLCTIFMPARASYLAATPVFSCCVYAKSQGIAKLHCLKEHILNRLAGHTTCCRCCRSRSWVLGTVVGLVCHNAHKQQSDRRSQSMARTPKCSSKVKTKRPSFAVRDASQRIFGSILSHVLSLWAGVRS